MFKIRIMALYSQHNTIYGWFPPPFPDGYKNMSGRKKYLSTFRHPHKTDPGFNHRLNFAIFYNLIVFVLTIETVYTKQP